MALLKKLVSKRSPPTSKKSRSFAFTIFDYDEAVLESLRKSLSSEKVRYAIFGHEICPKTQRPHLQGYISLRQMSTLLAAKKNYLTPTAHLGVAIAAEHRNRTYCSKEGKVEEFGTRSEAGKRNDLQEFKDAVKSGNRDEVKLREEFSEVYAKYHRFFNQYLLDTQPSPPVKDHKLRPWQQELYAKLKHQADDRGIVFVVDPKGKSGKSWFAKYYCKLHEDAFLMRPGKHADMAYQLPLSMRVLFIDCTRSQVEFFPYTFVEEVKDGYVMSTKYEVCIKKYPPVHVVVLMNQQPLQDKLSADRYQYIFPMKFTLDPEDYTKEEEVDDESPATEFKLGEGN